MKKSLRVVIGPYGVKVGRGRLIGWLAYDLPACYLEVLRQIRVQAELCHGELDITLVDAGLSQTDVAKWRAIKYQWPQSLLLATRMIVRLQGVSASEIRRRATWTYQIGNAVSYVPMPSSFKDWQLMIGDQLLPLRPREDDYWMIVEDMRLGSETAYFTLTWASWRFQITVKTVVKLAEASETARRFEVKLLAGPAVAVSLCSRSGARMVLEIDATTVADQRQHVVQKALEIDETFVVARLPIGSQFASFNQLAEHQFQVLKAFWQAHDVVVQNDYDMQRELRWQLYCRRQTQSSEAVGDWLHTDNQYSVIQACGLKTRFLPILAGRDDKNTLYLGVPALPTYGQFDFDEQTLAGRIHVQVKTNQCRIKPERHTIVDIAGRQISCPKQRYTTIWKVSD